MENNVQVQATITTPQVRYSVKDWMKMNSYDLVSPIRANQQGYLFCTFVNSQNPGNAYNVYLSIKAAGTVEIDDSITQNWSIVEVENAQGDTRLKLTNSTGDARTTLINRGYTAL